MLDLNELPSDDPRGKDLPPRVRRFLTGANPLVTVTIVGMPNSASRSIPVSRTMGGMIESYKHGIYLVMTCRHSLQDWMQKPHETIAAFSGPGVTMLRVIGQPIFDPEQESDVAFLLVQDRSQARVNPFILTQQDFPITGQTLYSSANRCDPIKSVFEILRTQQIDAREICWRGLYKASEKTKHFIGEGDTEQLEQLRSEGWRPCRILQMISRPSFSGSPVWDARIRLVGMNIGGSEPGTETHKSRGDVAICIPASELFEARRRVDPVIKANLAQLVRR